MGFTPGKIRESKNGSQRKNHIVATILPQENEFVNLSGIIQDF
jgi:hypothetical protein